MIILPLRRLKWSAPFYFSSGNCLCLFVVSSLATASVFWQLPVMSGNCHFEKPINIVVKISKKNIQLWLMDFELWQLPLELWQLPLELWQLPLALWHYSKSKRDILGTLATASGALATATWALATASTALATASRTLANISWLSNNIFVFWQLPGISSAQCFIRQPYQTSFRHLFEWIGLSCQIMLYTQIWIETDS